MANTFVAIVSYKNDGFDCVELFDTVDNANKYVALLEAGKVTATYNVGSATVDYVPMRGANWVNIYSV